MLPTHRNIMDTNIGIVTTTQFYFINIVEIDYVQLLLFFVVIFRRIYLERLDHDVILLRFDYLKDLEGLFAIFVTILQFRFTELTVEGFPHISCDMHSDFLVLIPTQPLPEALQVDMRHGARALAWGDQRIILLLVIREANPTHSLVALGHMASRPNAFAIARLTFSIISIILTQVIAAIKQVAVFFFVSLLIVHEVVVTRYLAGRLVSIQVLAIIRLLQSGLCSGRSCYGDLI